jgi:6-phosphogluconolactonase
MLVGFAGTLALLFMPAAVRAAGNAYVTNFTSGANTISQYAIGAGGTLSPLMPASVPASESPVFVAVTPDGRSAYPTSGNISQYDIDPLSGGLSPKDPPSVGGNGGAWGITIAPAGKSAHTTDIGSGLMLQYDIDPGSGKLTPKTPPTVFAGGATSLPFSVAITPDGKHAYVATLNSGVLQYEIDPLAGKLSPNTPFAVPAGNTPEGVAVTADGKSVYVTNINSSTISQYDIDPSRNVVAKDARGRRHRPREHSFGIGVSWGGTNACVVDDPVVSRYNVDRVSGTLSPKDPATVATGGGSTGIALRPLSC